MIDKELLTQMNRIREQIPRYLPRVPSFALLLEHAEAVKTAFTRIRESVDDRLKRPFSAKFVTAIVGSSGHGKTTLMDELFPRLSARGWLVTDVTDTTFQSLRVEHGEGPALAEVTVTSWNLD